MDLIPPSGWGCVHEKRGQKAGRSADPQVSPVVRMPESGHILVPNTAVHTAARGAPVHGALRPPVDIRSDATASYGVGGMGRPRSTPRTGYSELFASR